jgi:energy-coupling factor transporter transmembrane protein EcfT
MTSRNNYSCEILGLVVLTILSALSHFWYIMIAAGIMMGFAGTGLLLSKIILRAKREMLARLLRPAHRQRTDTESEVPVDIARSASPSLPVV